MNEDDDLFCPDCGAMFDVCFCGTLPDFCDDCLELFENCTCYEGDIDDDQN